MDFQELAIFKGVDVSIAASVRLAYVTNHPAIRVGILVTLNDDVYSIQDHQKFNWQGVKAEQVKLNEVVKIESLCGKKIVDIRNTREAVVVLTNEGKIYEWKKNEKPRLVLGSGIETQEVTQIACGRDHCLALTTQGQVYAWGGNKGGQLGVGNHVDISGAVKPAFSVDMQIKSISCGCQTSFAVDADGKAWSWGDSNTSLGYYSTSRQLIPKAISDFERVTKVVAGWSHVVALTDENELYYWGHCNDDSPVVLPTRILFRGVPVDVAATWSQPFCAFKTNTAVYLWGHWHHQTILTPIYSGFSSIEKAFNAAQRPSMARPLTVGRPQIRGSVKTWGKLLQDSFSVTGEVIRFKVDNEIILAYKEFLMERCDYFRCMLENDWKESDKAEGCIEIQGCSPEGFKMLIFFLYTDELMKPFMSILEISELLRIADFYQVPDLHQTCADMLKRKITPVNACAMYALAIQCNANSLQSAVTDLTASEFAKVMRSEGFADMSSEMKTQLVREVIENPRLKITYT